MDAKGIRKAMQELFKRLQPAEITETLPDYLKEKLKLPGKYESLRELHFPTSQDNLDLAQKRLEIRRAFLYAIEIIADKE